METVKASDLFLLMARVKSTNTKLFRIMAFGIASSRSCAPRSALAGYGGSEGSWKPTLRFRLCVFAVHDTVFPSMMATMLPEQGNTATGCFFY